MRILTGYTKEEQKEFGKLAGKKYPLSVFKSYDFSANFPRLNAKLLRGVEWPFMFDIADFNRKKAKFPEQLYYVKLTKFVFTYLSEDDEGLDLYSCKDYSIKQKFTMQEIKDIDERYVPFTVPVDEVEDDE